MSALESGPDAPDPAMTAATWGVAATGAVIVVLTAALVDLRAGLGAAIGAVIATLNLLVFGRLGRAFLAQRGSAAPWALVAIFKLAFLFGGVFLLLKSNLVSGIWLAVGYGALPIGITFGTLFAPKPRDDAGESAAGTTAPAAPGAIDATPSAAPEKDVIQRGRRPPADPPEQGG